MPFSNTSMSKASCIITKFMILFDVMIIWSYYASNKNKRTKGINLTRENIKQQNKVVRCCGHATYFNWSLSCVDSKKITNYGYIWRNITNPEIAIDIVIYLTKFSMQYEFKIKFPIHIFPHVELNFGINEMFEMVGNTFMFSAHVRMMVMMSLYI